MSVYDLGGVRGVGGILEGGVEMGDMRIEGDVEMGNWRIEEVHTLLKLKVFIRFSEGFHCVTERESLCGFH